MTDGFVHLHVASGFSMQYGASTPAALVARAVAMGQPALALTDRDGLYGAIRFVQACDEAGIAPILGVDLAMGPTPSPRPGAGSSVSPPDRVEGPGGPWFDLDEETGRISSRHQSVRVPVRGGAVVDPRRPRVTVLARGHRDGLGDGVGWARLCRLVTATHLGGERGDPVCNLGLVAEHATAPTTGPLAGPSTDSMSKQPALVVLLGPDSDVGRALLARRKDRARALLHRWTRLMPPGSVVVEVVCHDGPEGSPASLGHAARLLGLADETGTAAVLTAAVRHADVDDAVTVDVLDAARRLVSLDTRHLDRVTTAAHLAGAAQMAAVARRVCAAAGGSVGGGDTAVRERAVRLLADTLELGLACTQRSREDLGFDIAHLPEPAALGLGPGDDPHQVLAARCRGAVHDRYPGAGVRELQRVRERLEDELEVVAGLGYPAYFLTVAAVCDLIRDAGVRVAARGSGAGSVVNYLLGISGVEPLRYGLLMERFCSVLRQRLPDIDIDVESARRTEIYQKVLERFGGERVTCVSMMDTYRVRHAIRDVGASLGLPPVEIDAIAKAFPHIAARNARNALRELPELRASGLDAPRLQVLFDLVERLDGLPRHIAVHPCGVVLSNTSLLDRTPVEASWLGFPMSQFDKDDVETMGLLKLDILGIRMQSAMAHAVTEVQRVEGVTIDLDDRAQVPLDDERAFELVQSTRTLGCFQIESPGQRELVGKFAPETFEDIIIDISLFRPGPVKSDMVTPFLMARQGWRPAEYLHESLAPYLRETAGVVVFHEQVLHIVAETTGVTLAEADEVRRAMGSVPGQEAVQQWWRLAAASRGYDQADIDRIWEVLKAFASFGFCKAHAAAFALPTYQSAWLKAHHPAAFLAGVLTHDPGMYPKRLILDDARNHGIVVLGLDVNVSTDTYRVERLDDDGADSGNVPAGAAGDGRGYGIRLCLSDVAGINQAEVQRIVAGQPFSSLADFWHRAQVSRPVTERLVLAGGFDTIYAIGAIGGRGIAGSGGVSGPTGRRGRITRRDLLLHVAELDRWTRAVTRSGKRVAPPASRAVAAAQARRTLVAQARTTGERDVRALAAAASQAARPVVAAADRPVQLALDLGDAPDQTVATGLPEMTGPERVRAELDILGLDASAHVMDFYDPLLRALGVTRAPGLVGQRSGSELLVAGVKVATQTPPIRSGRRVVFLTLDDASGPVDATFFEDVQGPYAATVFHSWMLLVRGVLRRTGPRGVSLRATGAWELPGLWEAWVAGGVDAVRDALAAADRRAHELAAVGSGYSDRAGAGAAQSRSTRPVIAPVDRSADAPVAGAPAAAAVYGGTFDESSRDPARNGAREVDAAGGMGGGRRRVLVHASGFKQSPYADVKPAGADTGNARLLAGEQSGAVPDEAGAGVPPRKLWHSSQGSSGH
ncbi:MAG TPA: DNA polymerase III subunit alpha [Dermatophilaceae bacterium]|nr:DNA polymerase III subunit alpha [Dermatophilaceae bacterium]